MLIVMFINSIDTSNIDSSNTSNASSQNSGSNSSINSSCHVLTGLRGVDEGR